MVQLAAPRYDTRLLREVAHFFAHAPATLLLKRRLSQAELYETLMQRAEGSGLGEERRVLARGLRGNVLEIGCGTGLMFPHYDASVSLTAIECDASFLALAHPRAAAAACAIELIEGDAMSLPLPDGAFDAVVLSLVLCSVPDVDRVLSEVRRVLRRGGELRALEHVRSAKPVAGALMHLFDPIWHSLNGQGCHMNRDPDAALACAGFLVAASRAITPSLVPGLPAFPYRSVRAHLLVRD